MLEANIGNIYLYFSFHVQCGRLQPVVQIAFILSLTSLVNNK